MLSKISTFIASALLLLVTCLLFEEYQLLNLYDPRFRLDSITYVKPESSTLVFESQLIPQPQYVPAAHSSSFTVINRHQLLAFWFAGTKEGRPDVKIWYSVYKNGQWALARALVDPTMIAKANHRYVIKVGNPVIYRTETGVLHLFVVSVSVGGWSGSALNHLISTDSGVSWSEPQRIIISPFFNISTLVRTAAIGLSDGGFYLPVYHEFIRKYPELLRFNKEGRFVEQIRITAHNHLLQPSVLPLSSTDALVYFRNGNGGPIYSAMSHNGGLSWSKPQDLKLNNPDSSLVVANLGDGRLLMVYNPWDRSKLSLATSNNGLEWKQIYDLESRPGFEFSYPSINLNDSFIDILYTYNRQAIKHVRFNRTWLNEVGYHDQH
jgi:predicted neuraminidase